MSAKRFQLGVLFVHGIGTQPSCNTLVQWGDQLLAVIERATGYHVTTRVERAEPGDSSASEPTEAVVRIHPDKEATHGENVEHEEWLLAEAWWADTFPAPTYRELVSWSLRAVPWALAIHIAQRYWQAVPEATVVAESDARAHRRTVLARAAAVLQLLLALALAPLFIVLLVFTLVLGLLPISQVRSVILSAQSVLTGTVGDSLAFVESPVRAALIRTRILASLERLIGQCDRTIVVAHSQGAAAVLDALGGIADSERQDGRAGPVPDTLLTFGAGINQLVSLKVLSRGLPSKLPANPAYLGVASLLGTVVLSAWLLRDLWTGATTLAAVLHAGAVLAVAFGVIGVVLAATKRWIKRAETPKKDGENDAPKVWILIVAMLAIIGITAYYSSRNNLPLGTVNLILFAILMSGASLILILSPDIKQAVTAPVREPVGLKRWDDLYASADPVPNGPTRIKQPRILTCIPIWNRGSVFSDHTAYWQNLDGFTLRVARLCARTAESPWLGMFPAETTASDFRAAWRLGFLRLSLWITRLAWLSVLVILWSRHGLAIPLPWELPGWVPFSGSTFTQWAMVPVLIAAMTWLTSRLLFWVWAIWTRAEQRATLAHTPPTDRAGTPVFAMGIIVGLVLLMPFALSRVSWFELLEGLANLETVKDAVAPALGWGVILALIARWRMPPPK